MDKNKWENFKKARDKFRLITEETAASLPQLKKNQQKLADSRSEKGGTYTVETPVVYNSALDEITASSEIKLILVADNPGRREQAAENRRYLVGPSGKIADKFFRENPALGIDFYKNIIILNKTPIHSPRTIELRELCKLDNGKKILNAIEKSQIDMASLLLEFQEALNVDVWITGYSEMKKGGIFEAYTETLIRLYEAKPNLYKKLFIYRHFSMNQFTIDLKQKAETGESVKETLKRIGKAYRERIIPPRDSGVFFPNGHRKN